MLDHINMAINAKKFAVVSVKHHQLPEIFWHYSTLNKLCNTDLEF